MFAAPLNENKPETGILCNDEAVAKISSKIKSKGLSQTAKRDNMTGEFQMKPQRHQCNGHSSVPRDQMDSLLINLVIVFIAVRHCGMSRKAHDET